MKTLTKLTVAAAMAAILGAGTAMADDQQLQNRLALQRAQMNKDRQTTIAVYGKKGVGERARRDTRSEGRWERHDSGNATHYFYRATK